MFPMTGTAQSAANQLKFSSQLMQNDKLKLNKTKKEIEAEEKMTPEERQLKRYQEDLARMREGNKLSDIYAKLRAGAELSADEIAYVQKNDPEGYRDYLEVKQEREAYKKQLKSCKTKADVEKLKLSNMGKFMSEAKSIASDAHIPKDKKLKLMQKLLAKTMGVEEEHEAFVKSERYQYLPEDAEEKAEQETSEISETSETSELELKQENQPETDDISVENEQNTNNENNVSDESLQNTEPKASATAEEVYQEIASYIRENRTVGAGLDVLQKRDK